MNLELRLFWDETISFDSFDPSPDRDGIKISVVFYDFEYHKLKNAYDGYVSTMRSATEYACSVVKNFLKDSEEVLIKKDNSYDIYQYDVERAGIRGLDLSSESIAKPWNLRRILTRLEERWYIEARGEEVNDCDYWLGFWGRAMGLWTGSCYLRGNPAEKARQLAYLMEQGLLKHEHIYEHYYILADEELGFSKDQIQLVDEINTALKILSKEDFIAGLRELAQRYEGLG